MWKILVIEAPKQDFKSLREVFEVAFAHEELVTKSIDEMVKFSFKQEDFSTFNFLQSLVAEQHEETDLFSTILDKFNVIGEESYFNSAMNLNELIKLTQGN